MSTDAIPWTGLFDLFRIGIGPSSSHTVGPMVAAACFVSELPAGIPIEGIRVQLFGSLALTGKGHGTDVAVILGLLGERPSQVDPDEVPALVAAFAAGKTLQLPGMRRAAFDPDTDIHFVREMLPRHPNALGLTATLHAGTFEQTYYSVGGGFIVTDGDEDAGAPVASNVPYPFATSRQLLDMVASPKLSIADLQRENGRTRRTDAEISRGVGHIWAAMQGCVERGLREGGELPGAYGSAAGRRGCTPACWRDRAATWLTCCTAWTGSTCLPSR